MIKDLQAIVINFCKSLLPPSPLSQIDFELLTRTTEDILPEFS